MTSRQNKPVVYTTLVCSPKWTESLAEYCEFESWGNLKSIPQDTFLNVLKDLHVHGLLIYPGNKIDAELLDAAGPQLKVIGTCSVGLNHVDLEECKRRGIAVGYTPGVITDAVAESTVGLILATARKYKQAMTSVTDGSWGSRTADPVWMCGKDIKDSTIGIFGLGRIGTRVATLLKAFGPSRILYNSRHKKDNASEIGAEYVSFETLLKESDFVIATCSINPENEGLFNKSVFEKMKKSAIFINVSRGVLVNHEDLYEALKNDVISAAGLDVTSPEPLPTSHPLLSLENCLILPHISSASMATRFKMVKLTADNILAGLKGEPLPFSAI